MTARARRGRPRLEDVLEALRLARADPASPESRDTLKAALASPFPHAVMKAAGLVGQLELEALAPDAVAAFEKLLEGGAREDKGCEAKAALADALYRLGHEDAAPFLRGIRCVQREFAYGVPEGIDTAVDVRGSCALGLVRAGYRDALLELAELLADPEPRARMAAARAIGYRGGDDAAPLLRLKVLLGDREPDVTGECLAALLAVSSRSLPFVSRTLQSSDPELVDAAIRALGASRRPGALKLLIDVVERSTGTLRQTALAAIADLRLDEGRDYLRAVHEAEEASE